MIDDEFETPVPKNNQVEKGEEKYPVLLPIRNKKRISNKSPARNNY
jgi:hypothetical protein